MNNLAKTIAGAFSTAVSPFTAIHSSLSSTANDPTKGENTQDDKRGILDSWKANQSNHAYVNYQKRDGESYEQARQRLESEGDKVIKFVELPNDLIAKGTSFIIQGVDGFCRLLTDSDGTPLKDSMQKPGEDWNTVKNCLIDKYPEQRSFIEGVLDMLETGASWYTAGSSVEGVTKGAAKGVSKVVKGGENNVVKIRVNNNIIANNNVDNILKPNGKFVGAGGTSSGIRAVSSSELDNIEKYLLDLGSKKLPQDLSYPDGIWYQLPNGQWRFGIRNSKTFVKTIDSKY